LGLGVAFENRDGVCVVPISAGFGVEDVGGKAIGVCPVGMAKRLGLLVTCGVLAELLLIPPNGFCSPTPLDPASLCSPEVLV
jgi:hypothetical protein